jgi:hypothetical protein
VLVAKLAILLQALTETYEIARGTGRFRRASGTLSLMVTVRPVLFNAEGGAQMLTMTGKFEGTISGISRERDRQGSR